MYVSVFRVVGEGPRPGPHFVKFEAPESERILCCLSFCSLRPCKSSYSRAGTPLRVLSGFIASPCEALDRARYSSRAARRSPWSVIEEFAISPWNYSRINWSSGGVFLFPVRVPLTRTFSRLRDWISIGLKLKSVVAREFFYSKFELDKNTTVSNYISFSCIIINTPLLFSANNCVSHAKQWTIKCSLNQKNGDCSQMQKNVANATSNEICESCNSRATDVMEISGSAKINTPFARPLNEKIIARPSHRCRSGLFRVSRSCG